MQYSSIASVAHRLNISPNINQKTVEIISMVNFSQCHIEISNVHAFPPLYLEPPYQHTQPKKKAEYGKTTPPQFAIPKLDPEILYSVFATA